MTDSATTLSPCIKPFETIVTDKMIARLVTRSCETKTLRDTCILPLMTRKQSNRCDLCDILYHLISDIIKLGAELILVRDGILHVEISSCRIAAWISRETNI